MKTKTNLERLVAGDKATYRDLKIVETKDFSDVDESPFPIIIFCLDETVRRIRTRKVSNDTINCLVNANVIKFENPPEPDIKSIYYKRVNNDMNGNPRYIVHYLSFLNEDEEEYIRKGSPSTFCIYKLMHRAALRKSREIGGTKYRGRDFGAGIVFQSCNIDQSLKRILEIQQTNFFAL